MTEFRRLSRATDIDPTRVQEIWGRALADLGHDSQSQSARRDFLARFPGDVRVRSQLGAAEQLAKRDAERAQRLAEEQARLQREHDSDPILVGLRRAEQALDADRLDEAQAELDAVLQRAPDHPEGVGLTGLVHFRRGQYAQALADFRAALAAETNDEAHAARWRDLIPSAEYWGMIADARTALENADPQAALARAQAARRLRPDEPEAILLQAQALTELGDFAEAQSLYRRLLAADPSLVRAWRGLLSLIARRDGIAAALDEARAATATAPAAVAGLDAGVVRAAIRSDTRDHPDAALRLLELAVSLLPDDPWLRHDLARRYAELDLPALAIEVMAQGVQGHSADPDMAYAGALVAASISRDDLALAWLDGVPSERWSLGMNVLAQRLVFDALLDRAHQARGSDPSAEAAWREAARGLAAQDAGRWRRVIEADLAADDRVAASADLAQLDTLLPADAVAERLAVIDVLPNGDPLARRWLAALLAHRPDDPDVLLAAAVLAHRDDEDNLAMADLSRIDPNHLDTSAHARADALRERILTAQKAWVETAWESDARHASEGTSSLTMTQIPIRLVWPHDYQSQTFVQFDALRLDAGVLAATSAATAAWGSLQVHPVTATGLPNPVDEAARGLSVEAGWRGNHQRWDLGLSGLGFAVPNVVGGYRADWSLDSATSLSGEWSRRALTGSLLAFAGATDPGSGTKWGAAVDNAMAWRWAHDLPARWSVSSALQLGEVTGQHLPANAHVQSRSVLERDWLVQTNARLTAGAVLNVWHYTRNESFFTLGQGGYYSPQRYLSLGVPIEATGRVDRWSYDLRLTPSRSWTNEQASPAFPVDAALQALSGNERLGSGQGGGMALSGRANLEYQFSAHGVVGAWLDLDRSSYYAPTRMMLYLRYQFEPSLPELASFPPRPVTPISRY
jgi:tetratricopeptide (TPR) repeat protein